MKKIYTYLIIITISVLSVLPLLVKSNIWGHDTNFHLANISDITNSISINNPLPKICTNIGNGLGYATHLFYAPLPHYIGGYLNLLFKNLNLGVDNCLTFIYLIVSILSGIVMFKYAYELSKNNYVAIISSIIYILMPYRIGDMVIRSSMNEVFIFLFLPMILLSLNRLINNKKYLLLFVIGYTGLILSHLVMALYTTLFIIIWLIIFYKDILKKDTIIKLIKASLLVTIFVMPFIILLLSQKINGNYMVFVDGYMSNIDYVTSFGITVKNFLIPLNDYSWEVPQFINLLVIISSIISIYFYFKNKVKDKNITYLITLLTICFIMCLNIFPWKLLPKTLYMIQFPWRLQTYIALSISIISPLWIKQLSDKKIKTVAIIFCILLVIIQIPFTKSTMSYKYLLNDEIDYNLGMGHSKEYLPVNSYKNLEYFNTKEKTIKCNNCNYIIKENNSKKMVFEITSTDKQIIELPRLYYTGYELRDKNNHQINFYENSNGLIEFVGSNNKYTLIYKGPILYRISVVTGIITAITLIATNIYIKSKKN